MYNYSYAFLEESDALLEFLSGLTFTLRLPSSLLGIAGYVLTALALYTIAQRRGIRNPWLAWIPVADCWILGSLSDQYQYVVNGQNKSKRKTLLALNIVNTVLAVMMVVLLVAVVVGAILSPGSGHGNADTVLNAVLGPVLGILGLSLPIAGISLAVFIIRCIALYDIYKSLDPNNCVLYLVLSILFQFTEPFFLFFNRDKDGGMPPRREAPPAAEIPQYRQTPGWDEENKNYL